MYVNASIMCSRKCINVYSILVKNYYMYVFKLCFQICMCASGLDHK